MKDSKIIEITPNKLKMDMLLFKNDILKDLKILENNITDKYNKQDTFLKSEMTNLNEQVRTNNKKLEELSNLICVDKERRKKIEDLMIFKGKIEDFALTTEIQVNNLEKDTANNFYRLDNILKNSVIYPGLIGITCKYKTFHDLIDYIVNQINALLAYKEKTDLDLGSYKNKLETIIQSFKLQIDNIMKTSHNFTRKILGQAEERINDSIIKYNEMINHLKFQFIQNSSNFDKKIEEVNKKIESLISENINEHGDIMNRIIKHQKEEFSPLKEKFSIVHDYFRKK